MEIWGDGLQRRSFLWIEDCVDAVLRLLRSPCTEPVNIGSERSVSIKELAALALRIAGVTEDHVEFQYDPQKPVGVASRNSNNDFILQQLGWELATSLEEGMAITGEWIGKAHPTIRKPTAPIDAASLATQPGGGPGVGWNRVCHPASYNLSRVTVSQRLSRKSGFFRPLSGTNYLAGHARTRGTSF